MLAILGYHKVGAPSPGAWENEYYVPAVPFEKHLGSLRDLGWQVLDLPTLLQGLADPASLPARAAVITFDDGYRCVLEVALPCLQRFGYPAVHFVPTDYIGGWNEFDHGAQPTEPLCTWDELRKLEREGVSVQPHGAAHRHFSELTAEEQERELRRSKEVLEAGLGRPVEMFSFPYGDDGISPRTTEALLRRTGYRAACLFNGPMVDPMRANPYRLPRLAMGPDTDLERVLALPEG
jgi:peptidoglycan/xylan/chitin deacetylase (PgdA/CDA1 family)